MKSNRPFYSYLFVLPLCCLIAVSAQASDAIAPYGEYASVNASDTGHCYGWSLSLWKKDNTLFGFLEEHAGLCGDPNGSTIKVEKYDPKSGVLEFSLNNKSALSQNRFVGTISKSVVKGKIGPNEVEMPMESNPSSLSLADWDTSMVAWCNFWGSLGRIKGTEKYCEVPDEPFVQATKVLIHQTPDVHAPVLDEIPIASRVKVLEKRNGWYKILPEVPGKKTGWAEAENFSAKAPNLATLSLRYHETPENNIADRERWAQRAYALNPQNLASQIMMREVAEQQNDTQLAMQMSKKIFDKLPDTPSFAEAEVIYKTGKRAKAFRAFLRLAETGNADAQLKLSEMWAYGSGATVDFIRASKWLSKSAENGNASAQFRLAKYYEKGNSTYQVPQNYDQALNWFKAAHEKGNAEATYNVALYQDEGFGGLKADPIKAQALFKEAAERGSINACRRLGNYYASDENKDVEKAIRYLDCSVRTKYPDMNTFYQLSYLSLELPDSVEHKIQAYKWFILARMLLPDDSSPKDIAESNERKILLASKLNKQQTKKAVDLAVEWAKKYSSRIYGWMQETQRKTWLYQNFSS